MTPRRTGGINFEMRWIRAENAVPIFVLLAMAVLPLMEFAGRMGWFFRVSGSQTIVQHMTLWLAILGASLAARQNRLLSLATVAFLPERIQVHSRIIIGMVGVAIVTALFWGSIDLVRVMRESEETLIRGVPIWAVIAVMPVGFAAIVWRLIKNSSPGWRGRAVAACGIALPVTLLFLPELDFPGLQTVGIVIIVLATLMGLPIFATLSGIGLFLFWYDGVPVGAIPTEMYRLSAMPMMPAIPLFTLAGYILAEGGACERLVKVFRSLVGWMPGGLAIVTVVVFAFFTSFTGASGVTILSLGGLLFPVLVKSKYPDKFSIGLVTTSGSIGLLFPPSLPVILYGVYARTAIDDLFIGGLLPGLMLVILVSLWGVRQGVKTGAGSQSFQPKVLGRAAWNAKWELMLPVIVILGVFGGFMTLVETAALTVAYTILVEAVIYRDVSFKRDIPRIVVECSTLVGGVLIILGAAMGFTNYLIDAEIPAMLVTWVRGHIESPLTFLLALNVFLLGVGCIMDIYSAILVVVPLIVPIGLAFGIHPVHLGIIFLTNLELGYMTPPVGMNLFLAAYRFDRPIFEIVRATFPFLLIRVVGVALITYVPLISLGLLEWLGRL